MASCCQSTSGLDKATVGRLAYSVLLSVTEVKAISSLTHCELPLEVFWDKIVSFNLFLLAVKLVEYDQISSFSNCLVDSFNLFFLNMSHCKM